MLGFYKKMEKYQYTFSFHVHIKTLSWHYACHGLQWKKLVKI